jgi:hypothetical protein
MTHEHMNIADRLIHQAVEADDLPLRSRLLQEAQARATLALAQEVRLTNLLLAYGLIDDPDTELEHPLAAVILARTIRRRLGLFPDLSPDGEAENGGN